MLYIFWLLHQTTTSLCNSIFVNVVYLLTPTSNHNYSQLWKYFNTLYIFWLLHQTTTRFGCERHEVRCISFDSYIKPQLTTGLMMMTMSCISFDSYIKPQLNDYLINKVKVVYLLTPTSNHNFSASSPFFFTLYIFDSYIKPQRYPLSVSQYIVVYLLTPTSNHNALRASSSSRLVVYLLTPTSNHNLKDSTFAAAKVVYLLTPTSNHNSSEDFNRTFMLYIFWLLHQTTTFNTNTL